MNNDIALFRYAVEVEKTASITLAAENLYMSQPSLSKAIRDLEARLGYNVFERTSRGILPTRKGRVFLGHAHAILRQMAQIEALSTGDESSAQVLSLSTAQSPYVAEAVTRFVAALDGQKAIRVRVQETDAATTIENVAGGEARLGIIRHLSSEDGRTVETLKKKGLKSETVWEYEPALLLSRNSPLAFHSAVSRADLGAATEISGDPNDRDARLYVSGRGMKLEMVSSLPWAYMWTCPVPDGVLERYDLVQRTGLGLCERRHDRLIYADDTRLSPTERSFIDKLFEVRRELAFGDGQDG